MLRLPPLTGGRVACRLPLFDDTALRIADALLTDRQAEQIDVWRGALEVDPALAAWTACRAFAAGGQPLDQQALAPWLAEHALAELNWPSEAELPPVDADDEARFRRWRGETLAAARTARASAPAGTGDDAYFAHLLRDAPRWLAVSAEPALPGTSAAELTAEFPTDLADDWRRLLPPALRGDVPPAALRPAPPARSGGRSRPLPLTWLPRLVRCLRQLRSTPAGDEAPPVRISDADEFERRLQREKLAALKSLAYGASHEINNPLANIATRAQTLLVDETDPERRRSLATMHAQALRGHEMIANLMHFAQPPARRFETLNLRDLLGAVVSELAELAAEQQTELTLAAPGRPLAIVGDRDALAVAVRSVIVNALEAVGAGGQAAVAADDDPAAGEVRITVADTGPGVDEQQRPRLFDPFFSGREAGRGLGFGLSWAWRIVDDHGGRISLENRPGGGVEVEIVLPQSPGDPPSDR